MALTNEQLIERKAGIFSTDAAAALGLSKYSTPVRIWQEKTGMLDDAPKEEASEAQRMGHVMQPVIGKLYEEATGRRLSDVDGVTLWHPTHSFMGSHFDFAVADAPDKRLVECKNFHPARMKEFGDAGSGDVPMDVLIQCAHEAIVWGTNYVDVAVLFGGQAFRIFPVTVSDDIKSLLVEKEEAFWRKVIERVAPEPITPEEVRALFPKDNGTTAIADQAIRAAIDELRALRAAMKQLEDAEAPLLTKIQTAMGSNSALAAASGEVLVTWKKAADGRRIDTERLKKDGLYEEYSKPTEGSRRFLLKG
jgi:predicted phage-related endonuclease